MSPRKVPIKLPLQTPWFHTNCAQFWKDNEFIFLINDDVVVLCSKLQHNWRLHVEKITKNVLKLCCWYFNLFQTLQVENKEKCRKNRFHTIHSAIISLYVSGNLTQTYFKHIFQSKIRLVVFELIFLIFSSFSSAGSFSRYVLWLL